jgi:hypothetical protein
LPSELIFEIYREVMSEPLNKPSAHVRALAVTPVQAALVAYPAVADKALPEIGVGPPASELTPEEQMARFAKELQENDWGHQPC